MPEPSSVHVPVLLEQVLEWLAPQPGMVLVDGTLGGGGHTQLLAAAVGPGGQIIALDRDPAAIDAAARTLRRLPVRLVQANFCDLPEVLEQLDIREVDGVLLDLGLSSDQLADHSRGFSFSAEGPLDLRFDPMSGEPARRLINRLERGTPDATDFGLRRGALQPAHRPGHRGASGASGPSRRRPNWPS